MKNLALSQSEKMKAGTIFTNRIAGVRDRSLQLGLMERDHAGAGRWVHRDRRLFVASGLDLRSSHRCLLINVCLLIRRDYFSRK